MGTPFKMKGMSFGNSPMKQDNKKKKNEPGSTWNIDDYLVDSVPARKAISDRVKKESVARIKALAERKNKKYNP